MKNVIYSKKALPIMPSEHLRYRMLSTGDQTGHSMLDILNEQFNEAWGVQGREMASRTPKKKQEPESTWGDALDAKKKPNLCGSTGTKSKDACKRNYHDGCENAPKRCGTHCEVLECKVHAANHAAKAPGKEKGKEGQVPAPEILV